MAKYSNENHPISIAIKWAKCKMENVKRKFENGS